VRPTAVLATILLTVTQVAAQQPTSAGDLQSQISQLAALDYPVRMNAARLVRRAPVSEVVPTLTDAVKSHSDEFVRYRALVVLTAFNDRGTGALMRTLLTDRNDRLREVAYKWLEQRPDPSMRFPLLSALQTEQAEFVRPALVAALAALDDDPEVQRTLTQEVTRGLDLFRSAAIDALGHHRAAYAVDAIAGVAANDGPLQVDAVLALGRIGGSRARTALMAVADAPADVRLTIRGAQCLLGDNCDDAVKALQDAAMTGKASTSTVRAAAQALSAIAESGNDAAMASLVALSGRGAAVREAAALAAAGAALRKPDRMIAWLNAAPEGERIAAISLLKDGFEGLEEDFAEEQFFAVARASYWSAAENSAARGLAANLIQALEF
jgi:predicted DCC family thiol-disulfide oxidoreductase YuxK